MPVTYKEVMFRNENSIPIDVTVEAPLKSTVVKRYQVAANSTAAIPIHGVVDCASTRITAEDGSHMATSQTFEVAKPQEGRPAFLSMVAVRYSIGSFKGRFAALTEGED